MQVSAGYDSSGASTSQGKIFTWGNNFYGQLGHGCGPVGRSDLLDPWDDVTNYQRLQTTGANQVRRTRSQAAH